MRALKLSPLPKPDEFGNYWLGARPTGGAVILHISTHSTMKSRGKFFASRGVMGGVLFRDGEIQCFDTAEEAQKALIEAGYDGEGKA